ncbi:hypothetical protein QY895_04970 [Latilactobacillus sakei]
MPELGPAKRTKKLEPDEQINKDRLKADLDDVKKKIQTLLDTYFVFDEATTANIQRQAGQLVQKLVSVTLTFRAAFQAEKERRHLLDFSDLRTTLSDNFIGRGFAGKGLLPTKI